MRSGSGVPVRFGPYEAAVYRFASARSPGRRVLQGGVLPGLSLRRVPKVEPTFSKGEFVGAELAAEDDAGAPSWELRGTLTRGQVDTFLFAQLHYNPPLDLAGKDGLSLTTRVPEGQSTPNQLLVILHEQGGGDFLAETGRSLGAPGWEQTFIPLERFQLAGWSKDSDGVLDPHRIEDIRIGWGGYLGREGERVAFRFDLPQTGSIAPGGR